MTDLPEHSELVAGEFYSEAGIGEDGVLDAVLSERALIELNLLLGDEMVFPEVLDPQGNPFASASPVCSATAATRIFIGCAPPAVIRTFASSPPRSLRVLLARR